MPDIVYAARARRDLIAIYDLIARERQKAAEEFLEILGGLILSLKVFPKIGALKESNKYSGLRMLPVGRFENWLLFYTENEMEIRIVRIMHAHRDIQNKL